MQKSVKPHAAYRTNLQTILTLFAIILLAPLIAGLYGILHDQITYTISSEYYTKFKFYQFGFLEQGNEIDFPNPRIQVGLVGFLATWWMGLGIGIILGFVGLVHKDIKRRVRVTANAFLITIFFTFFAGLLGFFYGVTVLADKGVDWYLPDNLVDTKSFIAVGSIHNFGYLGGLIGLIIAIIYSVTQRKV